MFLGPFGMSLTRPAARGLAGRWRDRRVLALLDQVLVSAGTFLTTLLAARTLDTPVFSALSLTLLVSLLLANLHRAVITQPLNVLGASEGASASRSRLRGTLSLNGSFVALALPVFMAIGALVDLAARDILLGWLAFAAFAYQDTLRRHAYTLGDMNLVLSLSAASQLLLWCMLGLALAAGLKDSAAFLLALCFSAAAATLWGLRRLRIRLSWSWAGSSDTWREHRPVAAWLVLTVVAIWGASQLYLLLAAALGPLAVAHLAAARNLLNVMGLFSQTISNYAPSRVTSHLQAGGIGAVRQLLRKYVLAATAGSVAFLALIASCGEFLLECLYGAPFRAAAPLLLVMAAGYVMILWGTVFGSFSLGLSDSRSGFLSHLAATLFTLTAGIWMTRHLGLTGLVWGLFASLAIAAIAQGASLLHRMHAVNPNRPVSFT